MKRRQFLKTAGVGLAGTAIAAPAIAQSSPTLKWRLTTSWPKSLDVPYSAAETMSKYVAEATDNKFQIQAFAGGEIVPPFSAIDAVGNQTVEMCHTAGYYFFGKDPTFALYCSIPFGLNSRQQNAWFQDHGGQDMLNEFGKKFNLYAIAGGNTGTQMGGWFRKEINTVDDLKGLKMRIGGWAGKTMSKLGLIPQQIPGGDIYPALEKGTIDATEWVGPYDDEKLGFYKVAKYYYYPGWWEGGTVLHFFINTDKWHALPKSYQAIITAAAGYANMDVQAKYDARNPQALKRLVANGAVLKPFSFQIMEACLKASDQVNAETSAANADYKKILESQFAFRNDENLWWQVAEYTYENFMIRTRPKT
ncbi:MAG TPA: TRAP transporter substrate-binding protein [Xanthobacteraceae bacterium]|jgi:TRAP-type mannitol/chloroaromatic compound transport system substrate-binding protein|nr:TRAP transporter substrate-binding protein [Xanthobacteraceae bacterium]